MMAINRSNSSRGRKGRKGKKRSETKDVAMEWIKSIVIALILALITRATVVQAFRIPTESMKETLLRGDFLLVNKFIYGSQIPFTDIRLPKIRAPKRGDVKVLIDPLKARNDHDVPAVQMLVDPLSVDALNPRPGMGVIGHQADLPAGHADGPVPGSVDGHGHQGDAHLFAGA